MTDDAFAPTASRNCVCCNSRGYAWIVSGDFTNEQVGEVREADFIGPIPCPCCQPQKYNTSKYVEQFGDSTTFAMKILDFMRKAGATGAQPR